MRLIVSCQAKRTFCASDRSILDIDLAELYGVETRWLKDQIRRKQKDHDQNIELLFEYVDRLQEKEERTVTKPSSKGEIGFKVGGK